MHQWVLENLAPGFLDPLDKGQLLKDSNDQACRKDELAPFVSTKDEDFLGTFAKAVSFLKFFQ